MWGAERLDLPALGFVLGHQRADARYLMQRVLGEARSQGGSDIFIRSALHAEHSSCSLQVRDSLQIPDYNTLFWHRRVIELLCLRPHLDRAASLAGQRAV
jgi:hypothetical protein